MCNRLKKKEYANLNYLVQLNSDEIIDSTSKGNLTRFINHSCDPNSVGEKVRFEMYNLQNVLIFRIFLPNLSSLIHHCFLYFDINRFNFFLNIIFPI